jgi:hypothetical protein
MKVGVNDCLERGTLMGLLYDSYVGKPLEPERDGFDAHAWLYGG